MTQVKLADRVLETTLTTGTGTYNLAGATSGFQAFSAAVATGSLVPYIVDDGTNWECGIGTFTTGSPNTLARTSVTGSSNAGAAVNWGAGTRNVRLGIVAGGLPFRDNNLNLVEWAAATVGGTGDAVTLTYAPAKLGYSHGMLVAFLAPGANTTAVTINVNGLGTKALKLNGQGLAANAYLTNTLILAMYDSTAGYFKWLNPPGIGVQTSIASAATTDIGTIASHNVKITGTTTITALGSTATIDNPIYFLEFAGALTLTHNASSLILPSAANIATAAGDTATAEYLGSGNWRIRDYTKADGTAVVGTSQASTTEIANETAVTKYISPDRLSSSKRVAKAWVNFDGTSAGTITPRANFNVGSVTKNSTGNYTLNFTNSMTDANYSAAGMSFVSAGDTARCGTVGGKTYATGSLTVVCGSNGTGASAPIDCVQVNITIHGN